MNDKREAGEAEGTRLHVEVREFEELRGELEATRRELEATRRELDETRRTLDTVRDARDRFFGHASHELRSPLSAILGFQELLREGILGELPPGARDSVLRIGEAGRHMLHLVDGLVELNRIWAGEVHADGVPLELAGPLAAAAAAFRRRAEERGLAPRTQLPDYWPSLRTDGERLVRMLDLLVAAGVRHPAHDNVSFRAEVRDEVLTVAIGPVDLERLRDDTGAKVARGRGETRPGAGPPGLELGIRLTVVRATAELLGGGLEFATGTDGEPWLTVRIRGG